MAIKEEAVDYNLLNYYDVMTFWSLHASVEKPMRAVKFGQVEIMFLIKDVLVYDTYNKLFVEQQIINPTAVSHMIRWESKMDLLTDFLN